MWQPDEMEPNGKCAGHGHLEFPSCYECAYEFIALKKGIFQLGVRHALRSVLPGQYERKGR